MVILHKSVVAFILVYQMVYTSQLSDWMAYCVDAIIYMGVNHGLQ